MNSRMFCAATLFAAMLLPLTASKADAAEENAADKGPREDALKQGNERSTPT